MLDSFQSRVVRAAEVEPRLFVREDGDLVLPLLEVNRVGGVRESDIEATVCVIERGGLGSATGKC
jgi:hypothetical protein